MTPTPDNNAGCAIFPNGLSVIVAVVLYLAYRLLLNHNKEV